MSKRPDKLQAMTDAHAAGSGINKKVSRKLYKRTTAEENLRSVGANHPGYEIRYFDIHGKPTKHFRVRLFASGFEKGKRYRSQEGRANALYLAPLLDWRKIASDSSAPLCIVEGERKGAAACLKGIATIGLSGVWSWRTRIAGVSVPLPDFDLIKWSGRVVELCFDTPDVLNNIDVQAALATLATFLRSRGASVVQVILPPLGGALAGSKVGIDDYLLTHSADQFRALPRTEIQLILDPADPLRSAQAFLAEHYGT